MSSANEALGCPFGNFVIDRRTAYIVKTKAGDGGKVWHDEEPIGDKVRVYLDSGAKMLCKPEGLTLIGYQD